MGCGQSAINGSVLSSQYNTSTIGKTIHHLFSILCKFKYSELITILIVLNIHLMCAYKVLIDSVIVCLLLSVSMDQWLSAVLFMFFLPSRCCSVTVVNN